MTPPAFPRHAVAPFVLAAATGWLGYAAAGASSGTFFAGVAFAVLITPPFVAAEQTMRDRLIVAAAVFSGTALTWLFMLRDPYVNVGHWASASVVICTVVAASAGVVISLRTVRLPAPPAAAATTLLFALWLTWPIWLSPHLAGRATLVNALVIAHPLFAIDHAFSDFGPPWTERPMMYNQLSVLNQDVAYGLPSTIFWSVLLHALVGAAGWSTSRLASRRSASLNAPPPAATVSP